MHSSSSMDVSLQSLCRGSKCWHDTISALLKMMDRFRDAMAPIPYSTMSSYLLWCLIRHGNSHATISQKDEPCRWVWRRPLHSRSPTSNQVEYQARSAANRICHLCIRDAWKWCAQLFLYVCCDATSMGIAEISYFFISRCAQLQDSQVGKAMDIFCCCIRKSHASSSRMPPFL